RALQVSIFDLFDREFAVQKIKRHALRNRLLPNASGRIVARIGESESFEALGSQDLCQTGSTVRREVHDFFAARSAMETNEGPMGINFFLWGIERAMHVPIVAVSVVARCDVVD